MNTLKHLRKNLKENRDAIEQSCTLRADIAKVLDGVKTRHGEQAHTAIDGYGVSILHAYLVLQDNAVATYADLLRDRRRTLKAIDKKMAVLVEKERAKKDEEALKAIEELYGWPLRNTAATLGEELEKGRARMQKVTPMICEQKLGPARRPYYCERPMGHKGSCTGISLFMDGGAISPRNLKQCEASFVNDTRCHLAAGDNHLKHQTWAPSGLLEWY